VQWIEQEGRPGSELKGANKHRNGLYSWLAHGNDAVDGLLEQFEKDEAYAHMSYMWEKSKDEQKRLLSVGTDGETWPRLDYLMLAALREAKQPSGLSDRWDELWKETLAPRFDEAMRIIVHNPKREWDELRANLPAFARALWWSKGDRRICS
jgi:hypothetical protein